MGLFNTSLPGWLVIASWALGGGLLGYCAVRAPWHRIRDNAVLFTWLGTSTALTLVWLMRFRLHQDLTLQFLGAALMAWMFGPRLATLGMAATLAFYLQTTDGPWANFGLNLLLLAALPAFAVGAIGWFVRRFTPGNLFIFLIGNGLFGSFAATVVSMCGSMAVLAALGRHPLAWFGEEVLPWTLLLAWGEAITTGMIVTLLTVYLPEVMLSFDDRHYLRRPDRQP
ncbi:energy-coupling factor ABC transporter permease [Derxia gummosa]|uniref:Energy-coupling factor ABC transporter permease n=1 Tax=Derxia gummosa DSM 723 TaxID=1121388 RepID=A0A9U5GJW4_9BURK|nr:energy-coupling factor ABC transporter permease [Derxia gummosa]